MFFYIKNICVILVLFCNLYSYSADFKKLDFSQMKSKSLFEIGAEIHRLQKKVDNKDCSKYKELCYVFNCHKADFIFPEGWNFEVIEKYIKENAECNYSNYSFNSRKNLYFEDLLYDYFPLFDNSLIETFVKYSDDNTKMDIAFTMSRLSDIINRNKKIHVYNVINHHEDGRKSFYHKSLVLMDESTFEILQFGYNGIVYN